ncbi:MAG: hypothetical protein JWP12_1970 [Bacteroidetes bacterium]|nr:hypothetical protein [Bacteroidota bacterium]
MSQLLLEEEKSRFQKFVTKRGIYIAMVSTFLGLFAGIPLLVWFTTVTIVTIPTLLLFVFICFAIGLLPWRYVRDHLEMEYYQFAMYAFSGFGMCFLNFLLFINLNVCIHEKTLTYTSADVRIYQNYGNFEAIAVEDAALSRNLTLFLNEHFHVENDVPPPKKITIVYATGVLGFDTIKECKFQ